MNLVNNKHIFGLWRNTDLINQAPNIIEELLDAASNSNTLQNLQWDHHNLAD
jgi:hypothetical protein